MMYLIHGEHISKSREALLHLKQRYTHTDIRELDGRQINETSLVQALSSDSLFLEETVVVIERLFSNLGKKIKKAEEYTTLLKQHEAATIILWEDKELSKTLISKLGSNVEIQLFSYPVLIFQLLDTFQPANRSSWLQKYREIISSEPVEVVHFMLMRRLRQLLTIKSQKQPEALPSWQVSRLTNQARFFTMEQLVKIYTTFLSLELAQKTGTGILSLEEATEYAVSTL